MRVPLAEVALSSSAETEWAPIQTASLRILVVDDNVDAANTLAALLSSWGHEVRSVYGGEEALSVALEERPDIVLSDLLLGDLSGLDLARALRRNLHRDRHLLIAVTGFGQAQDRERSLEAGFDHHLVKPIDFNDLARLLARRPE